MTNCYRGRKLLTFDDIKGLFQRHSLMCDITLMPYVNKQTGYMMRLRLISCIVKSKCEKHTTL